LSAGKVTKTLKSAPIGALLAQKFTFVELQKKPKTFEPSFFCGLRKVFKGKTLLKVSKKTFLVEIMDIEFA